MGPGNATTRQCQTILSQYLVRQIARVATPLLCGLFALCAASFLQPDDIIRERQLTTLQLAFSVALFATPIGVYCSTWLVRWNWGGRSLAIVLLFCLATVPLYVQAAAWEAGFGKLGWYTVAQGPNITPWLSSWRAAVWVYGVAAIPWVTAIVSVGIVRLDRDVEELALLDQNPWKAWWLVVLPNLLPSIALAFSFTAIVVATELTVADLYMIDTVARELRLGFALGESLGTNWLRSLPFIMAWLVWAGCTMKAARPAALHRRKGHFSDRRDLTIRKAVFAQATVLLPLALLSLTPVGSLLVVAGRATTNVGGIVEREWSLSILGNNLATGLAEFRSEMFWTSVIGVASATLAVVLARLLVGFASKSFQTAWAVLVVNGLLLVVPGPLLGLSLVPLFNDPPLPWLHDLYDRSITAPVVVGVLRSLPVVTAALYILSLSVPQSVNEMARLDDQRRWARWWKIEWPLTRVGVALSWLMGLAITMGEHSATFAVTPPGMTTMANRIFVLIHSGARQKQASLTLIALGCFIAIALGIAILYRCRSMYVRKRSSSSSTSPKTR